MTPRTVTCGNCGISVNDDTQKENKELCPNCGSILRNVHITVNDSATAYDSLRVKQKDPSKKSKDKLRVDSFSGYERSHMLNKIVEKQKVIDKNNNRYHEKIIDPDTKEVIHECNEKLSDHKNHGYAKLKKKT